MRRDCHVTVPPGRQHQDRGFRQPRDRRRRRGALGLPSPRGRRRTSPHRHRAAAFGRLGRRCEGRNDPRGGADRRPASGRGPVGSAGRRAARGRRSPARGPALQLRRLPAHQDLDRPRGHRPPRPGWSPVGRQAARARHRARRGLRRGHPARRLGPLDGLPAQDPGGRVGCRPDRRRARVHARGRQPRTGRVHRPRSPDPRRGALGRRRSRTGAGQGLRRLVPRFHLSDAPDGSGSGPWRWRGRRPRHPG